MGSIKIHRESRPPVKSIDLSNGLTSVRVVRITRAPGGALHFTTQAGSGVQIEGCDVPALIEALNDMHKGTE